MRPTLLAMLAAALLFPTCPSAQEETALSIADLLFGPRTRTLRVDCDRGQTVTRALARAGAGDTILVRGTCTESVVIDKAITLDGGGSARIVPADPSDATIRVTVRRVHIRGFILESTSQFQIAFATDASATVESNVLRNATNFGVSVGFRSFATLLGNTITDCIAGGVLVISGSTAQIGIDTFNGIPSPNTISDNVTAGIIVAGGSQAEILGGNTISNNNLGVLAVDTSVARVAGNQISGNNIGILVDRGGVVQLPLPANPNPVLTALNTGENAQMGIACQNGTLIGVADLQPAVSLPAPSGALSGVVSNLNTLCIDQTVLAP